MWPGRSSGLSLHRTQLCYADEPGGVLGVIASMNLGDMAAYVSRTFSYSVTSLALGKPIEESQAGCVLLVVYRHTI